MKKPDAQKNGLRILIVRISAIGDVLHVTSVVHNLRRLLPDAEITWLASPPASLLLETNPDIDRLLVWDRRTFDKAAAHLAPLAAALGRRHGGRGAGAAPRGHRPG